MPLPPETRAQLTLHYTAFGDFQAARRCDESEGAYRNALRIWQQLAAEHPNDPSYTAQIVTQCRCHW
jgi:hypothetical protein